MVKKVALDFFRPARFEQDLFVETFVIDMKKASLMFQQRLVDDQGLVYCEGKILVACVTLTRMKPRAIPQNIVQELKSGS